MSEPSPLAERPPPAPRIRVQAGLAFVQRLRPALYALLAASALFSFWAGSELGGRRMPGWVESGAPILFGAFLLIFAVYRIALVRARRYPASTGLFQIGLGALVFMLLLPGARRAISQRARTQEPATASGQDDVMALMSSTDRRVRALAVEVAGARGSGPRYAQALADRLDDSDAQVRAAARAAIGRILGLDPTGLSGISTLAEDAAASSLRNSLRSRGWLPPLP